MMAGVLILLSMLTYGQNLKNDPTYSVNNYKHPNKAALARKLDLDKVTKFEIIKVNVNNNYKQVFNTPMNKASYAAAVPKTNKSMVRSSKHPYGL
jgi:hypothetical protein